VLSPWLTWRFVHWSGMEAAAVMHGSVAANPVSSTMRTSGSQARFAAQQAVTTMLLGGVASKTAGKPTASVVPLRGPAAPGGGSGPGGSNGSTPPRRTDGGERP